MTGRLREDLLERVVEFGARTLNVADELDRKNKSRRVVEQLIGCGTSVGANLFEASEAMSSRDFVKTLGVATKELSETRFWLLVLAQSKWIGSERLDLLLDETNQLLAITKSMIARTKRKATK